MRKTFAAALLLIAIASVGLIVYAAESQSGQPIKIDSFEFLGCSGDWTDQDQSPEIWRMGSGSGMTYLVRHQATCGADAGRDQLATLQNGILNLHYESYSTTDIYAMCLCEFWAKFTFKNEPAGIHSATFDSQAARLKGSWPER